MKVEDKRRDRMKWIGVVVVLALGLSINYHYAAQPFMIRLIAGFVLLAVMLSIVATTSQSHRFLVFVGQARIELYKVVWPSRQETVKSTLSPGITISTPSAKSIMPVMSVVRK